MIKELKRIVNEKIWRYCLIIFGFAFCSAYRGKIMIENYNYVDNFLIVAFVGILFLMSMICCDVLKAIMVKDVVDDINGVQKLIQMNTFHTVSKTTLTLIYLYILSRTVYSYSNDIVEMIPVNIFIIFAPIVVVLTGIIVYLANRVRLKK